MEDQPLEPVHTTPRWVKMFGGAVIVLAALMIILHLGSHRVGSHGPLGHDLPSFGDSARGLPKP